MGIWWLNGWRRSKGVRVVLTGGRMTPCVPDKSRDLKMDKLPPRSTDQTAGGRAAANKPPGLRVFKVKVSSTVYNKSVVSCVVYTAMLP